MVFIEFALRGIDLAAIRFGALLSAGNRVGRADEE